ncbi:MAG: hypothetical protein QOH96_1404 [Blastocatellia bacterium]|jgi:hypothetical protein|nr:hypothetical protein [Blastocatellia bacterium]
MTQPRTKIEKFHGRMLELSQIFVGTITVLILPSFLFPHIRSGTSILNSTTGKTERWLKGTSDGIDADKFSEPQVIHWKSFDDRQISGFLYRPPTKVSGKRPVIIDIHGGPDDQARPDFNGGDNLLYQ